MARSERPLIVHDVHAFDARRAAAEFMRHGFTAVDDVTGGLIDCANDELIDALGLAVDEFALTQARIETSWGPIFVFWDRSRGPKVLAAAKAFVATQRPTT